MYISVTLIKILKAFGTVLIKGCVFEKVMAIKKIVTEEKLTLLQHRGISIPENYCTIHRL